MKHISGANSYKQNISNLKLVLILHSRVCDFQYKWQEEENAPYT